MLPARALSLSVDEDDPLAGSVLYLAGDELELAADDAKTLIAEGVVEKT